MRLIDRRVLTCRDDSLDAHVLSHKYLGENFVGGAHREVVQEIGNELGSGGSNRLIASNSNARS